MLTRKSIHTLITEAATAKGVPVVHSYEPGVRDSRNGYFINGVWMTPGDACKALGVSWP